jgi:hypothetical protein
MVQYSPRIKKVGNQFLVVRGFKERCDIGEDVLGCYSSERQAKNKLNKLLLGK